MLSLLQSALFHGWEVHFRFLTSVKHVTPQEGYIDVTFVDDCAILLHAPANERILHMLKHTIQAFTQAAGKRGLQVNFDQGKTEVLWNVIGKGAKALKQALHAAGNTIQWQDASSAFAVHVCHQYKHLGTWILFMASFTSLHFFLALWLHGASAASQAS